MLREGQRMASKSLSFYQIHYREDQATELYPFAIPHFNTSLTPYFENSVIVDLVPPCSSDLISVCSWRLRRKRGDSEIVLRRGGEFELTEERIKELDYDIAVLTPRSPTHRPLAMARNWHGAAWDQAFAILKGFLFTNKLCKIPDELDHAIYENHFIAQGEIYRHYVSTFLIPCIEFMRDKEVFNADSGYIRKLIRDPERVRDYKEKTGQSDYPIAPFILERLFSIYCYRKNFKIINL